jgi:DNA-binding GntR family transcriptional regulator
MGTTTPDFLFDALKNEIYSGLLKPGSALRQEEIANKYKVSRIPVREALLRLESTGLINIKPNRGAYVIEMDEQEIREVYDLRILLECDLLSKAIPMMVAQDYKHAQHAAKLAELISENDPDWIELDNNFHFSLYAAARQKRQLSIIQNLRNTSRWYRLAYNSLPNNSGHFIEEHQLLIEACQSGDIKLGVETLRTHLANAAEIVLENISTA